MKTPRRHLLRLGGAALVGSLAGCTSGDEPASTTEPTSAAEETTEPATRTATVAETTTQPPTPTETATQSVTATPTATSTTAPTATPTALADGDISIADFSFDPMVAAVEVGTTVTWTNEDGVAHNVVAEQFTGGASSWSYESGTISAGGTATHTFESAGAYEYYCAIHGQNAMCGVVLVGDADKPGPLPCE